jgi:sulfofructose kinase
MSAAMWDVVGLGENSVDRVLRLPAWPGFGPGAKVRMESQPPAVGGQVVTALCTCASLGLRAAYVGVVGHDAQGALIREELTRRGIDLGAVLTRAAGTREAVILVEPSGERVVLWSRDAALALRPSEVPADLVQRTRVLHVDAVDLDAAVHAAQLARAAGAIVTCDLDDVGEGRAALFEAATHPILAEGVPSALTGEADVVQALQALGRRHAGPICVTRGAQGALLVEGGRVHQCPAPAVQAVDTTGAGDVFRGAYIAARLEGLAPDDVLKFACAAAAVSCTRVGAVGGVPTRAEVDALLA